VRRRAGRQAGVTLMELMIVVAIVGVLAAIAYPAYTRFVIQTNRSDATKTMDLAAQSLQRCYSVNFSYAGCSVNGNIVNDTSTVQTPNNYYTITFSIPDPQDYTMTAAANPGTSQSADNQCFSFTLSSTGQQAAADNKANNTTQACWGSN